MADKKTILIVDDEEDLLLVISMSLEKAGFHTVTSGNGNEALEKLDQQEIDLVISDFRMANGSGRDLLDSFKKMGDKAPPLILMTGFSDLDETEAFVEGYIAFYQKPFNMNDLVKGVEMALLQKNQV